MKCFFQWFWGIFINIRLYWSYPQLAKIELGAFLYYFFCYPAPRSLREKLRTKHTYIELTYGETSYGSFQKIIEELQLNVCDTLRFCDLGCGRGRLLWYAAIVKAWECCGLDAIPAYIKRGQRVVAREGLSNVSFIQGDFCEIDLGDFDVVYVTATCLEEETWQRLMVRFSAMKPGSYLISVSRRVRAPGFECIRQMNVLFGWGMEAVFVYRKISQEPFNLTLNNA